MNLEKCYLKHGSINYKYLMKYPKVIEKDDSISKKVKKDAEKDLLKQIGNKVLNVERDIINKEKLEEFEKIKYENNLIQGISDLISLFSQYI